MHIPFDPSIDGRLWRVNFSPQGRCSPRYVRKHVPDYGQWQIGERTTREQRPRGLRPVGIPTRGPAERDVLFAASRREGATSRTVHPWTGPQIPVVAGNAEGEPGGRDRRRLKTPANPGRAD